MAFNFDTFGATSTQPKPTGSFDFQSFGTTTTANPAAQGPDSSTFADKAFVPATGKEGALSFTGKILANLIPSAGNFVKGIVTSPFDIAKAIGEIPAAFKDLSEQAGGGGNAVVQAAKQVPETLYKAVVPQFIQHALSGDYQKAAATIENDPVGQILPLVLLGRTAASAAGKTAEFDQAISTLAKPVTAPAGAAGRGTGSVLSQILGASTGGGASSIKEAAQATPEFRAAMRGQISPDEVVQEVQDAVTNIRQARGDAYRAGLEKIGEDKTTHDITPVVQAVQKNLERFNVKVKEDGSLDFSRSSIANNGSARADIQGVFDTIKDWGSQEGDTTGIGLDTLKKQLTDFYSPSGQARAFVQAVKSTVSDILSKNVKGYTDLTKNYTKVSNLLDDIKSATGIGGAAKHDTVFTKLTQAMRGDKDFRLEVLRQIESTGNPRLMDKIAGINLSSAIPRGLVGRGTDIGAAFSVLVGHFNPSFIPVLLSTSPRVVGEFVNALGLGAKGASRIIDAVNKLAPIAPYLTPATTLQENLGRAPERRSRQ